MASFIILVVVQVIDVNFILFYNIYVVVACLFIYLMVFEATFNNISVISWRSVLLVGEIGGPGENHRHVYFSVTNLHSQRQSFTYVNCCDI